MEARHGSHCFEIPLWHQRPVRLSHHLERLRRWRDNGSLPWEGRSERGGGDAVKRGELVGSLDRELTQYMKMTLTPFLDSYYDSIRSILKQLSSKMSAICADEMKAAGKLKESLHSELAVLAKRLNIPAMCDEERRASRTLASGHVARVYACVESARADIDKMAAYIEEMIDVIRRQMARAVTNIQPLGNASADDTHGFSCRVLSQTAAVLGFELDLSLTNAHRHSEQSCQRLARCSAHARRDADRDAAQLTEEIHQCVYA